MTQQLLVEFITKSTALHCKESYREIIFSEQDHRCLWYKEETDVLMMIEGF